MSRNIPPERDIRDFEFIQLVKFRVTAPNQEIPVQRGKLLACSSQYGLVAYTTHQGFSIVRTADLLSIDEAKGKERSKVVVEDVPVLASTAVGGQVICLDVNSDGLFLAVAVRQQGQLVVLFYDMRSFADKGRNPAPFGRSQISASPSALVSDMSWNPAAPTMLAVCTSDGNVELIDVTDMPKVAAVLPAASAAACFCWSPKGKQLLVGRKDGTLAQYDHVLAEKKVWPCPSILAGPHRVVDVVWQSTYIFLAAYLPAQAQPSDQPTVVMSMSNKENKTVHINFEDVCYGNGEDRMAQYFFHFVQKWDIILMASSNAAETTIVGRNLDDKVSWEHWNLEDCSRAALPLTSDQLDSFPVGVAVDYSPSRNILTNDGKNLPPFPVMYLLSSDGMLVGYHLAYTHRDAAQATTPALPHSAMGARNGVPELAAVRGPQQHHHHVAASAVPSPNQLTMTSSSTPSTPHLPVFAPSARATSPSTISAAATPFSLPKHSSAGASTPAAQLPFSNFTPPVSAPAAGIGSKPGAATPTSAAANQKQQPSVQAPPTSAFSQSLPFSFGGQSTMPSSYAFGSTPTTASSAFSNLGTPFSMPSASPSLGKPFSQSQPSGLFGSGQTLGTASIPNLFGLGQTTPAEAKADGQGSSHSNLFGLSQTPTKAEGQGSSATNLFGNSPTTLASARPENHHVPPPQGINNQNPFGAPKNDGQVYPTTPSTFGHTAVTRDEGFNTRPHTTPPGPQPLTTPGPAQPRHQAPSAFTPKPAPFGQAPGAPSDSIKTTEVPADTNRLIEATVDSAFTQNILEEIADFERELSAFRTHSRREVKTVGTREEMQILRQDKEKMVNYVAEINKATKDQLQEVQDQKGTCFNLLAMSEECQTRHKRDLDPHYHSLLLNRVLDPASTDRLKGLQQMAQALEQSVLEVDRTLDGQWQDHLTKRKKEERFFTPAGETIYKSIRNNHIVIATQRQQLEKLEEQLKSLRLYNKLSGRLFNDSSSVGDGVSKLKVEHKPGMTLNSAVANGMTPEKVAKLRDVFSQRKVSRVKSTAPANLSMSRIVHLTPGKSPVSVATPTPAEQQQYTPQRPQQQRKHQLLHPVQSLTSPSSYQTGPAAGQPQPGAQKHPDRQQTAMNPDRQQTAMNQTHMLPGLDGAQRHTPTSFPGVVHYKQVPEYSAPNRFSNIPGPSPAKPGVGLPPGATTPSTPGARLGGGPSHGVTSTPRVTSPNAIYASTLPHSTNLQPSTPHSTNIQSSTPHSTTLQPSAPYSTNLHSTTLHSSMPHSTSQLSTTNLPLSIAQQSNLYENITPTETEEDDDDYDEEDNGYEDEEEEEEEEEEETGFEGIPLGNQSLPRSNLAQMLAQQAAKNLPGAPFSAHARADGTSVGTGLPLGGGVTTSSGGLFKLPQSTAEGDVTAFAPLKTTTQAGVVPSNSKPSPPPTGLASRNLFGGQLSTGSVFGGPAVFGSKAGPQAPPIGPVFGSQATPSRAVGFNDVTETERDSGEQEKPVSAAKPAATDAVSQPPPSSSVSLPSAAAASQSPSSSSAAAVSSAANAFSFVKASSAADVTAHGGKPAANIFGGQQATSSGALAASVFGGQAATSSIFGAQASPATSTATASVFGGKSPPDGSRFSFGTTPSASAAAGLAFSDASSSQTSTGPASTGSVFGAAGAASPGQSAGRALEPLGRPGNVPESRPGNVPESRPGNVPESSSSSGVGTTEAPVRELGVNQEAGLDSSVTSSSSSVTAAPSGFGTTSTTTSPPPPPYTSKPAAAPLFGSGTSSTAGKDTTSTVFDGVLSSATAAPLFGSEKATTAGAASFGSTPSIFGGGGSSSLFGSNPRTAATASSVFGSAATTTSSSVFGTAATTTSSSVFGSAATTTASSVFGSAVTTTASSVFGSSTITPSFGESSATSSIFGGGTAATTTSSVFGGGAAATTTSSVFGGGAAATTTSSFPAAAAPLFGATTTTAQPTGLFSSPASFPAPAFGFGSGASTSTPSVFGTPTPASSESGVFGGSGGGGLFGSSGTPTASSGNTGLFGSSGTPTASSGNTGLFGSSGTPTASSGNTGLFGSSGTPTASSGNTGLFGSSGTPAASSGNTGLFGSSGTPAASSGNTGLFGTAPSAFNTSAPSQAGSLFGQPPSSAGFGSTQPASSGGGSSAFGQTSAFGQQTASSSSGSLFGFGGLGGKPSEEKAKLNVFGSPQVFGAVTNQNPNLFGSGGTSSFGGQEAPAPSFFSSAGAGRFTAEAAGVSSSGFGVSSNPQTSGAFGAAPAFGSAPSFGGASTFGSKIGSFGSSPSFGGSPSFGAPTAAFPSPGASGSTFGGSTGGGFSSFASTGAPSFDQLAQSSPVASGFGSGGGFGSATPAQPQPFGGGFGTQQSSFGGGSVFGQGSASPGLWGAQPQAFAANNPAPSFNANPAFSSYRG